MARIGRPTREEGGSPYASKAEYDAAYEKENLKSFIMRYKKEELIAVQNIAAEAGMKTSEYVKLAIREKAAREGVDYEEEIRKAKENMQ